MPTYYPATQAEIDAALAAFYSGAPIPNGFAVNLTWPEKVRRVDPDAPAPAWPGWFSDFVPDPGEIVVGGAAGPVKVASERMPAVAPLRAYHAALANVANSPVDILCIGDSVTEGGNAANRETRWVARLREAIRQRFQPAGVAGGEGYVPLRYYHASLTNLFTLTGTFSTWGLFGLGGNRNIKVGTGFVTQATATIPAATRIKLLYGKGSSVGTMDVKIDAGSAVAVNGNQGATADGGVWDSGALTAGAHTITITPNAGTSAPEGIMVYNGDENAGIRMWEAGHSGFKSGDALAGAQWFQAIQVVQPKLVFVCYGLNDYSGNVDPAVFATNLTSIIANVRTNVTAPPSIVLLVPLGRNDVSSPAYPWSSYVRQIYNVALADGDVAVCDLSLRAGTQAQARSLNILDSDNVHLSPAQGGQWWANALAGFVAP